LWPWFVIAVAVVAGIFLGRPGAGDVVPVIPVIHTSAAPEVVVHVAGWVVAPGLVRLPEGARVADAIEAVGGVRTGAQTHGLNLAQVVVDGQRIEVPAPGESVAVQEQGGRVRINQADAGDLQSLPGVGPVLAERIVAYRDEHGQFEAPEDLLDVPGIGESKLDSIRDLIILP